jgi:phage FluMu protein Com
MREVRCDGIARSGPRRGTFCHYLLCRVSEIMDGQVETKCPRCNALRMWTFYPARVST